MDITAKAVPLPKAPPGIAGGALRAAPGALGASAGAAAAVADVAGAAAGATAAAAPGASAGVAGIAARVAAVASSGVASAAAGAALKKPPLPQRLGHALRRDYQLWILLAPAIVFFVVFHYLPLYGIQIAFRNFKAALGIIGSPWVGLKNFQDFFGTYYSSRLLLNTLLLNVYNLLWGFPAPIILAILLNQVERKLFKRFAQTIVYVPHFISTIVMAGILYLFLSPTSGIVNYFIQWLGGAPIFFMNDASWFRKLFVITEVWQHAGWSAILYIATLTGIDQSIYEAATIDGASKRQKIWHIDMPHLIPIAVMILILSCGSLLASNTDKALAMQQPGNMSTSDIIGVYVYTQGLGKAQFSYTSAIGLTVNLVNFIMIVSVNWISKKLSATGLF